MIVVIWNHEIRIRVRNLLVLVIFVSGMCLHSAEIQFPNGDTFLVEVIEESPSQMVGASGSLLQTTSVTTDMQENPISRTSNGLTLSYEYDGAGRNTKITDPEGISTVLEYDLAGRRIKQSDKTSGETQFTYNTKGNLTKQTDARGKFTTFEYDALDRITKLIPSDGTTATTYSYDQPTTQSVEALGKLTKITGEFGTIELGYDTKGAESYRVHTIDDIKAYLKTETDSHGRLTSRTLPDGTKLRYDYAPSGHMVRVAMATSDGNSINHTVAQYAGPITEDGKFYLERKTGNNVSTKIEFDPLRRRPTAMKTTLAEGQTAQDLRYTYDEKGNITEIKDFLREDKNQTYEYDSHNRITKAIGKYGTEEYEYTAGGNLKKRGQFTLSYDDANHKHAVTKATSPNTGVLHYSYDAVGNMVSRNGDTLIYDANRKLKEMIKADGIKYLYLYDQNGLRVKKTSLETGEIVYSLFGGMYEIARRPSKPESHTVYIRGIKDDLLAQITREDASLLIAEEKSSRRGATAPFVSQSGAVQAEIGMASSVLGKVLPFCKDKSVDCKTYLKNASKFYLNKYIVDGAYHPKYKNLRMIVGWGIVLGLLYLLVYSQLSNGSIGLGNIYKFISPLLLTSILFTFTSGCGIFTTSSGRGDAPWILLAGGINSNTPSVRDDGMAVSGGGGGIPFTVPVTGMYFVHSDHLGSVSFLTNGRGAIIAGGEFGGKSDIQYKPYGEIDRPHSSGPDISKYKYTGQEEDKESGLLYYKARYYDPGLGRFLQADDVSFPDKSVGMNRYMYVDGNPIINIDIDGYATCAPKGGAVWAGKYVGPGAGGCAGTYLFSDFTDLSRAANLRSPLFGVLFHLLRPDLVSFETAALYWGLNHIFNNPQNIAQSKSDEISIEHDQEFGAESKNPFTGKNLKSNAKWIGRNVKSIFSPGDWRSTYNREKNAISKRNTLWGKKRGKYGDATSLVAGVNTVGTRLSDLAVTIGGSGLFTLGFNPIVSLATIYNGNLYRLKINKNRFNSKF